MDDSVKRALNAYKLSSKRNDNYTTDKAVLSALELYEKKRNYTAEDKVKSIQERLEQEISNYNSYIASPISHGYGESAAKDTLEAQRKSRINIGNLRRELDAYRDFVGDGYNDAISSLDSLSKGYDSALDYAQSFSQWKTEDDYKEALRQEEAHKKARTELLNLDLGSAKKDLDYYENSFNAITNSQTEINRLKGELNKYKLAQAKGGNVSKEVAEIERKIAVHQKAIDDFLKGGTVKDLEKFIESKKLYYNEAESYQKMVAEAKELEKIMASPDFMGDAQKGYEKFLADEKTRAAQNEKSWWEVALEGMGQNPDMSMPAAGLTQVVNNYRNDRSYMLPNETWSDEDKNLFGYYYLQDRNKAFDFAEATNNEINRTQKEERLKGLEESTTSNWYTNLGYQGLAILGNATGIVDYLDNILEFNARGTITEKNYASAFEQAQTIRNTTAEYLNDKGGTISEDVPILGGKGWGDAYQLGTSVADSMITANALGPYGTAVVFFGSAGASAVDDALDRGATPLEAVKYGTLMGAAEAFAEYIGADKLLKIGSSKVPKQFFMNVLKQGGAEGIEEGVTSVLGQFADNLVMADKSEFNTRIKEYMIYQGMSYDEAVKKAWAELAESVAYDTLAGFASGNISGGIQTSANTIKGRKATGNTIKEKGMTSALADMGKTFGENSKVAKMSSKITDKSSAYSLGGLYDRVSYEIGKENQSDIADLLVMRGMTTEDAQSTSKWLVKAVNGEELTKNQQKALNENPIISSVFDEVSNSIFTVDDRLNLTDAVKKSTSNDVLSDKINEANADKYKLKQIAEEAARKQFGLNKVTSIETDTMLDSMVNDAVNMAKESKYKSVVGVIAEGNKVSKEDGVSVKKVASVGKDGTIMVELNDGTVADSDDIVYKSDDDAVMYISTANLAKELNSLGISFDTTSANAVAKGYNPISGVSASTYMLGAEEAIRYGVIGYNRDSIRKDSYYHKLTKPQQDYLYQIGRDIAEKSTKKENSGKASATSNKSKKGKVTKAIKSKLKDSQQTAISTVEKLSKAGILKNNFYFFESVDGTTVVKGREVKARVLSEDIGAYKKGSLAPNGIHVTASGDIYIDINAGNSAQGIALYTLAHELGHFVKEQNAEGFKVLADFVADKLGGKFETLIQEKLDLWDELGRTEFNYMDAYEDVVCDALEPMFTDGNLAEKLVEYSESSSKGKSLLKTLKEFFSNLYKRIQKAYAQLEPDDPAAQIIKENQKSVEKLADLFAKAIVGANENFVSSDIQAQKNTTDEGDVSFSIREDFYNQLDNWDGETTGFSFVIGTTSEALLEAGIPDKQIRWDSSKIKALLNKHNGMTIETVREIPELLEHPVVVIDSKNNKNSRIVMGDLHDKNGKIVTTVLLLTPTSRKGNQLDIIKVSSAQGRGHIESLFKNEDGSNVPVRFVDKKRIQNWLNANRLQLPLHSFNLDSNNIILTPVEKVKENFGKDSEQDIAEATLEENGIVVDSSTKSASLSVRYLLGDAQKTKVAKSLAVRFGVTEKEALNWLTAETSLSSLILNPKYSQYLDYEADPDEVAIKQNSDYPQGTVDFSPICAKRREFTSVMNNILRLFPNHVFAATDLAKIRTIMQEEGMTIPCGICYVEDRRQLDTIVAQDFIDGLKLYREGSKTRPDGKPFNANQLKGLQLTDGDTYIPSVYELVSLEGRNKLKAKNPNMEAAWVKYNNARGMQAVRLLANEAEYKRQILDYSKSTVKAKNDKGGLRIYSFSDAEMFHLIDIIQVITDSSAVGLCLQGYTKVNEYAKAVKDTGEKLNRSLIPKGELGYHMENGKVVLDYDTVEGIDINSKDFFDNRDNPNIGNITIGVSDVQIRAAMVSDFVDQIIPFHTGQSAEVLGEKGIATWTNYKDFQAEKDISTGKKSEHQINIYTEVLQVLEKEGTPITKRSFVEKFLQVCKENELTPRFSQFLNTNENGEYVYTEGYHKMLVDFKTFAQTEVGEYLPQMPVKPIFDNEYITNLLNDYVGSQTVKDAEIAKSMPKVVERITNEIINPSEKGQKFSLRNNVETTKDLVAMHNITPELLIEAINRGTLIMPSLAITNKGLNDFGEISLVFKKESIDPDVNADNKLFGADAWTPTQTPIKKNAKFDTDKTIRAVNSIKNSIGSKYVSQLFAINPKQFKDTIIKADGNIYEAYAHNIGVQTAYAMQQGLISKIPTLANGTVDKSALQKQLDSKLDTDNVWRQYKKWLNGISDDIITSYDNATNDEILNKMKAQPETAKTFKLSVSGELVVPAVKYDGIDTLRKNKHRLSENADAETKVVANELLSWAKIISDSTGIDNVQVVDAINNAFNHRYNSKEMVEAFDKAGIEISQESANELQALYKKSVELPTRYFEAKPQRMIDFSEVAYAVIPANTSKEIRDALTDKGIEYVEYEDGKDKTRLDALNSLNNVKFSVRNIQPITETEYQAIEKHFGTTGNFRVAGYLLTDGKLLDFSGKHWGDTTSRMRQVDHREVEEVLDRGHNGVNGMIDMIGNGNIRLMPEIGGINLAVYPNEKQRRVLSTYINYMLNTEGGIIIDYDSVGGDTVYSKSYGKTATSRQILNDIRNYFNGARQSELMAFHTMGDEVKYSDRDYRLNNRYLLANALESTAKNEVEREWLAKYKANIASLEADQRKLDEINAEIKAISFTKGSDRSKLTELNNNKKTLTARINRIDKRLLEIEAAKPLKKVLEVEKKRAIDKINKQARENIAAEKEKSAKTVRELMDRYTERIKKNKEGRDKTALRHKIIKVVKDLNNLLIKPTKERHIPEELRIAVSEALSIVNMDTVDAENRVAKYNELIAKATDPDVIASLTETRDRILTQGDKLSEKLGKLKEAYGMIQDSTDDSLKSMYDDVIYTKIETVQKMIGKTPIRNMTMAQLESVYDLYTMVLTSVRDSNKAFAEDLKMTRLEIGSNVFGEIKDHNKARDRIKHPFIEKFGWQNLKPMQAMKTIGSSLLQKLWNNVLYGQEVFAQDYDEAVKFAKEMKEKHGYDKWDLNKLYSFESKSGKAMKINLEQMMSIYAYSKRHQADEHIEYGGIVLNEGVIKEKNKLGKVVEVKVNDSTAYRLNKLQIAEIIKTLEEDFPGAKDFVDEMQKYLSETMGEKGNEVSMKMYGIKLFKEEHYFPLKSSKDFMEAANAKLKGDVKIKNKGMTKSTVEHAKNPIVLEGFLDVWGNHINEMAMYHGLVLPLEDFSRALNYGFKADDKLNTDAESVRTALHDAFGDYADNYLNELLKAINGGVLHDSSAEFADKAISKFKKAKVMASLSVIIQQPTAIIRAMGIIEPKYFSSQNFRHKQTWEELKKYCPTAIIKETGSFDTNMGRTIVDMVKDDRGFTDKVGDVLGKAPAYMDEMGWNMIWRALKNKVATEQNLSGELLLKECGKQMTLILNETQVYDSVMARSELMRSKNTLTKMATAFMAEPSTVANMIYGAVLDYSRGKKDVATKTVAATIASVVINGLVSSLVYAFRDDDEDETFLEKYASAATTEVLDGLNPLTYIPFVKDVYSLFQGYKVERTDMALVSDVVDAINKFYKVLDSDAYEGMSSGETTEYIYNNLKPLLTSICDLFGLPVGNVLRDAEALIKSVFNDNTESKGMGEAFKEGVLNSLPKIIKKIAEDMESDSK